MISDYCSPPLANAAPGCWADSREAMSRPKTTCTRLARCGLLFIRSRKKTILRTPQDFSNAHGTDQHCTRTESSVASPADLCRTSYRYDSGFYRLEMSNSDPH